ARSPARIGPPAEPSIRGGSSGFGPPAEVDAREQGSYPRAEGCPGGQPRGGRRSSDVGLSYYAALALALLIGVAGGALLVSARHVRPRPPREIRVTVTPN